MTTYIQIGTNNGNDNFRKKVLSDKPDKVVLVEANPSKIMDIKNNYKNINGVYVINKAIYYNNDEDVELYIPAKNGIYGTKADNNITYSDGEFSLLTMNDWGEKNDMVKIKTKSITFEKLCDDLGITDIAYLQIDTEGFDSEIIQMIDFSKHKINTIRYEKWNFDTECFSRYHDEAKYNLGINGMKKIEEKLKKLNYTLTDIIDGDGNDIIATLN